MPAPPNAPAWAAELALSYESGATSQFILFGNVHDRLAVGGTLVNLADFLQNTLLSGFGVVLTYDDSGYVSDEDASKINYDDLLREMQSGEKEVNAERVRQNYPPIRLVGWAAAPHYDARAHKIYWAEDLIFGDEPAHTLNYDMRVLGRRGVLQLKFVASMDQLATVEASSRDVLAIPEFKDRKAEPVVYEGETPQMRIARRKAKWTPSEIRYL